MAHFLSKANKSRVTLFMIETKIQLLATALITTAIFLSSTVNATLMVEEYANGTATPDTIGGYSMTDFGIFNNTLTGSTITADSPLDGSLAFFKRNLAAPIAMDRGLASTTSWWVNGESHDYDVFTTDIPWVEIILPENTRAISFNVGTDDQIDRREWFKAGETNGVGIDSKHYFDISPISTMGFGIYADNSAGNCSAITSITIDPYDWGFGNFSINNDPCGYQQVPEPTTNLLLILGLAGLLLSRRSINVISDK